MQMKQSLKAKFLILSIFSLISLVIVVVSNYARSTALENIQQVQDSQYQSYLLADELRQSSDDLTKFARAFVNTGDEKYALYFQTILDIRNGLLPRPENYHQIYWDLYAFDGKKPRPDGKAVPLRTLMIDAGFTQEEFTALSQSQQYSDHLVILETKAMNAMRGLYADEKGDYVVKKAPNPEMARQIMFSADYFDQKAQIMRAQDTFIQMVEKRTLEAVEKTKTSINVYEKITWASIAANVTMIIFFLQQLFAKMILPISSMTKTMKQISGNNLSTDVPFIGQQNEVGAMARAVSIFRDKMREIKTISAEQFKENWIKGVLAQFSEVAQVSNDLETFANQSLSIIAKESSMNQGLFYAYDEEQEHLYPIAHYATGNQDITQRTFALGTGFVGQCAADKQSIVLNDIPDEFTWINSGFGDAKPHEIIYIPLVYNHQVLGVLALSTTAFFNEDSRALYDEAASVLAINLLSLIRSIKTEKLLLQTQQQSEELQASEEELRASDEEIRARNEELMAQEEELRHANEELKMKSSLLESRHKELEEAQKDLAKALEQAKEVSRYKSEFLANVSHELRTPLNSMLILSEDLLENAAERIKADDLESVTIIHQSGQRLLNLINEILDLSKVESGQMTIVEDELPLVEMITQLEQQFNPQAKKKGLTFAVEKADALPQNIRTDGKRIMQVLTNLIGNAMKFTDQGSVILNIFQPPTIPKNLTAPASSYLCFAVKDSGIGISKDNLDKIFTAFQQVDGADNRQYEGTGLGLSISQKFAELLGGTIEVESTLGQGSTFSLYVLDQNHDARLITSQTNNDSNPVSPPSPPNSAEAAIQPTDKSKSSEGANRHINSPEKIILVVEDDADFAKLLMSSLAQQGVTAHIADNGASAVKMAIDLQPDGILLDYGLPDMNGDEILEILQKNSITRHIPIHIVSGQDVNMACPTIIGKVTKPISQAEISRIITEIDEFSRHIREQIIVLKDLEWLRDSIQTALLSKQADIIIAENINEMTSFVEKGLADCLIMPFMLDDKKADETIKALRQRAHLIPPILIVADKDDDYIDVKSHSALASRAFKADDQLAKNLATGLTDIFQSGVGLRKGLDKMIESNDVLVGKTIMIIDDDMRNIFALSKTFKSKGVNVVSAQNAREGIDVLERDFDRIDLVLMDIMMPGMNGYEAIQAIRKNPKLSSIPIISVTAKAMRGEREKCLNAGADDYISKPINLKAMYSLLRIWL